MSTEEEDRLDFGEEEIEDDDRESEISLGLGGDEDAVGYQGNATEATEGRRMRESDAQGAASTSNGDNHLEVDDAPLPEGWERRLSRNQEVYYLNLHNYTSTWDVPTLPAASYITTSREASPAASHQSGSARSTTVPATAETPTTSKALRATLAKTSSSLAAETAREKEDGETESEKDPNSPAIAAFDQSQKSADGASAPAAWGRRSLPYGEQSRAYTTKESIQSLAQPAIARPQAGPSAGTRGLNVDAGPAIPTGPRAKAGAGMSTEPPKGPKADRERMARPPRGAPPLQGLSAARSFTTATTDPMAGIPTGPASRRRDRDPEASRPSVPRNSIPAIDNGWPQRTPSTSTPALSSEPEGYSKRADRAPREEQKESVNSVVKAYERRQLQSADRAPKAGIDAGWPKRDSADRGKDPRTRSPSPPRMRSAVALKAPSRPASPVQETNWGIRPKSATPPPRDLDLPARAYASRSRRRSPSPGVARLARAVADPRREDRTGKRAASPPPAKRSRTDQMDVDPPVDPRPVRRDISPPPLSARLSDRKPGTMSILGASRKAAAAAFDADKTRPDERMETDGDDNRPKRRDNPALDRALEPASTSRATSSTPTQAQGIAIPPSANLPPRPSFKAPVESFDRSPVLRRDDSYRPGSDRDFRESRERSLPTRETKERSLRDASVQYKLSNAKQQDIDRYVPGRPTASGRRPRSRSPPPLRVRSPSPGTRRY